MEDSKVRQLFDEVMKKTRAGRIVWTPTANEFEFLTVLPGRLALVISIADGIDSKSILVQHRGMILRDENLQELLRATPGETISEDEFSELYHLAARNTRGVEAKVDKLLLELARM